MPLPGGSPSTITKHELIPRQRARDGHYDVIFRIKEERNISSFKGEQDQSVHEAKGREISREPNSFPTAVAI